MSTPQKPLLPILLHAGLAFGVSLLFGVLSLRHVGDSVFLADQADQLQFYERLLRLEPEGLLGPVMSGPPPPTRTTGPLGALLFGIPVALGLGVDAVQAVTSVVLALTTLGAFAALARMDLRFAWAWLMLFVAHPIVWWNAGILWANTLLLPAGNLVLLCMALCLHRPTLARWWSLVLVEIFATQANLAALAAAPAIAVVLVRTWMPAWRTRPSRRVMVALVIASMLAVGPYLLSETMTGFANSRAVLAHVGAEPQGGATAGRDIALAVLQRAADPAGLMQRAEAAGWTAVWPGAIVALLSLGMGAWWLWRRPRREPHGHDRVMLWLVLTSIIGIAGQVAFFVAHGRELFSYHYISMLLPLYAVPGAALIAWILGALPARMREIAAVGLAFACALLLWTNGRDWADRYYERTDWTYARITGAVNELCGDAGSARTVEASGFDSLMPGHDGVVKYLMTRGFVECRYDEQSAAIIAASREGNYEPMRQEPDGAYELVEVVDPGIALYRRARP